MMNKDLNYYNMKKINNKNKKLNNLILIMHNQVNLELNINFMEMQNN